MFSVKRVFNKTYSSVADSFNAY